jgi:hypothetical protein
MGVKLNEVVTLDNALTVPNMYYGIIGNISVSKNAEEQYFVRASFAQWASEQARKDRKKPIGIKKVEIRFDSPPNANVYQIVYDKLKEDLGQHADVI